MHVTTFPGSGTLPSSTSITCLQLQFLHFEVHLLYWFTYIFQVIALHTSISFLSTDESTIVAALELVCHLHGKLLVKSLGECQGMLEVCSASLQWTSDFIHMYILLHLTKTFSTSSGSSVIINFGLEALEAIVYRHALLLLHYNLWHLFFLSTSLLLLLLGSAFMANARCTHFEFRRGVTDMFVVVCGCTFCRYGLYVSPV